MVTCRTNDHITESLSRLLSFVFYTLEKTRNIMIVISNTYICCIFQLVGAGICAIGLWAWTEKDMFSNIGKVTSVTLDPALVFIITGGVMFFIGFCGCIGALRENTCLLMFVSFSSLSQVERKKKTSLICWGIYLIELVTCWGPAF